jgi:3'(2'), 5'-bisphosphate nucleotidase
VSWAAFPDEQRAATAIAERAGNMLLELRAQLPQPEDVASLGDRTANDLILEAIRAEYPDDAILSEESTDDLARLEAERLWIVDPLDGSREFGQGRDDWAVHVAFVYRNQLAGGAVALPPRGRTLSTLAPVPRGAASSQLRIVVSRSRAPRLAHDVAVRLSAQLMPVG